MIMKINLILKANVEWQNNNAGKPKKMLTVDNLSMIAALLSIIASLLDIVCH